MKTPNNAQIFLLENTDLLPGQTVWMVDYENDVVEIPFMGIEEFFLGNEIATYIGEGIAPRYYRTEAQAENAKN